MAQGSQLQLAWGLFRLLLTLIFLSCQTLWATLSLVWTVAHPLLKRGFRGTFRSLLLPQQIRRLEPSLLPTHVRHQILTTSGELERIIR
nr:MAG: hypothetical protein [Wufeng shrew polycipivirus 2]